MLTLLLFGSPSVAAHARHEEATPQHIRASIEQMAWPRQGHFPGRSFQEKIIQKEPHTNACYSRFLRPHLPTALQKSADSSCAPLQLSTSSTASFTMPSMAATSFLGILCCMSS